MNKLTLICFSFFLSLALSQAQEYKTGIGIRAGLSNGLTVKHFLGEKTALEAIISRRWEGFDFTGLYEIHNIAFNVDELNWYYGFGGHIGFWNGQKVPWIDDVTNKTVVGINGVLGLEYRLIGIPFTVGIDWKPTINLLGVSGLQSDNGAISIRYIF